MGPEVVKAPYASKRGTIKVRVSTTEDDDTTTSDVIEREPSSEAVQESISDTITVSEPESELEVSLEGDEMIAVIESSFLNAHNDLVVQLNYSYPVDLDSFK